MARRTLEAIAVDQGEIEGGLADRLHALEVKGVLHAVLADSAKEVRLAGNIGAHFEPIEQVTVEDAQQLVNFIRELLKYFMNFRQNPREGGRYCRKRSQQEVAAAMLCSLPSLRLRLNCRSFAHAN